MAKDYEKAVLGNDEEKEIDILGDLEKGSYEDHTINEEIEGLNNVKTFQASDHLKWHLLLEVEQRKAKEIKKVGWLIQALMYEKTCRGAIREI